MNYESSSLRKKAEEILKNEKILENIDNLTNEEIKKIIYEYKVHQIELELQARELKESNYQLTLLKDKYIDLYETAPIGYVTIDTNGMIRQVNTTFSEMLYRDKGYILKRSLADFLSQESKEIFYSLLLKANRENKFPDTELVFLKANNTKMYTRIKSNQKAYIEEYGYSYRLAILDITTQKQYELELMLAKDELEKTIDALPFIFILQDDNYRIVNINKEGEKFLKKSAKELVGTKCYDVFCDTDRPCDSCPIINLKNELKPVNFEIFHKKFNRYFYVSLAPVILQEKLKYVVHIVIDITERKLIEEKLNHLKKMEALGTLAAGIAHEFNNILTGIVGYAEIGLLDKDLNPKIRESLNVIKSAGVRARDLVSQILLFARKTETVKTIQDITPLINDTIKLLRRTIPTIINIKTHIQDNLCKIKTSGYIIQQILMNLATNSAHALKDRKDPTIEIRAEMVELDEITALSLEGIKPGKYLMISVSDNGIGIPDEIKPRIFEPFFTTKKHGEGTGMGLATVYGLVKDSDGAISFESQVNVGTCFKIYLPCAEEEKDIREVVSEEKFDETTDKRKGQILWIDDEEIVLSFAKTLFSTIGCDIVTESDPSKALEIFKKSPEDFALVITDYSMPIMNGIELARKLFEIKPDLDVVLITGYSDYFDDEELKKTGIKYKLRKPVTFSEIKDIVKKLECSKIKPT